LAPLKPAFDSARGGVAWVMQPVIGAIGSVWGWLTRLLEPIQGTGAAAEDMGLRWGAAIAGMIHKVGELLSWLGSLADLVFAAGAEIGNAIGAGIMSGIEAIWGEVKALAGKLADALPDWVRKKLGIHSPSRVFAQIGQHTMAGPAFGLRQRLGAPLALGAAAAPITIHLTINAAPGTDAQGLAQLAGRELTAAAERVAALYDRSDIR
jgi:hypothetical protein